MVNVGAPAIVGPIDADIAQTGLFGGVHIGISDKVDAGGQTRTVAAIRFGLKAQSPRPLALNAAGFIKLVTSSSYRNPVKPRPKPTCRTYGWQRRASRLIRHLIISLINTAPNMKRLSPVDERPRAITSLLRFYSRTLAPHPHNEPH